MIPGRISLRQRSSRECRKRFALLQSVGIAMARDYVEQITTACREQQQTIDPKPKTSAHTNQDQHHHRKHRVAGRSGNLRQG